MCFVRETWDAHPVFFILVRCQIVEGFGTGVVLLLHLLAVQERINTGGETSQDQTPHVLIVCTIIVCWMTTCFVCVRDGSSLVVYYYEPSQDLNDAGVPAAALPLCRVKMSNCPTSETAQSNETYLTHSTSLTPELTCFSHTTLTSSTWTTSQVANPLSPTNTSGTPQVSDESLVGRGALEGGSLPVHEL